MHTFDGNILPDHKNYECYTRTTWFESTKRKGKKNNVARFISCYQPYVSAAVTRMV